MTSPPHLFDIEKGNEASVINFIDTAFEHQKNRMRTYHRSWALNLAWTKGHQNVDFNRTTLRYTRRESEDWQSRLISNLMLPIQVANVARLATVAPVWDLIPATPDEEDIQISRVSKMLLDHQWLTLGMPKVLLRLLFWQSTCSNVYLKIGWDPDAGEDLQINSQDVEQELLTEFLEIEGLYETPKVLDVKEGGVFINITPPFNLTWEPLASVLEESLWSIETQIRSLDWMVEKYGNKWKDKLSETDNIDILLHPYILDENEPIPKKGVITHELFVRHSKRFKKGLYCLVADNQVVVKPKDHPYKHGELPYIHFLELYDPSSQFGTCAVEQIRPNQARYNAIQSRVTDAINVLANPKWLVPFNSGVKEITNAPDEVIHYRFPLEPKQTQSKPMPAYVQQTIEQIRADIQDTSSIHNVSQGQNEPGLRSGRAVLALQSSDDEKKGPTLIWFDDALRRVGIQVLELNNQFVTEERVLQITGEFNAQETLTFSGAMLQGNNRGNYYDVRVNTYARNFMSRSGRENLLATLLELGILNPQTDKMLIMNMLDIANTTDLFDEMAADRARQWREIQEMSQGQPVEVLLGENHEQHLRQLTKFMASARRDQLEPQNVKIIQEHLVEHKRMQVVEAIQQQMMVQGIIDGRGSESTSRGSETTGGSSTAGTRDQKTGVNTSDVSGGGV